MVDEYETIQSQSEAKLRQVAFEIANADFLLIATGAGFSADSGLPTYSQVAENEVYKKSGIDYSDLCRVQCLQENPRLFYGFWGACYNTYRDTKPHIGFDVLYKWCHDRQARLNNTMKGKSSLSAYYLYTSNVDGHFRKAGFPEETLHELHGAIDVWLPLHHADDLDAKQTWIPVPEQYTFPVDPDTLEGPTAETILNDLEPNLDTSFEMPHSTTSVLLRPRVLMFDDGFRSHTQLGLDQSCTRYQDWEEKMEQCMESSTSFKLVVLEIGCGMRVPSVRTECQDVIRDTASRCSGGRRLKPACTFIRINPEHEEISNMSEMVTTISIRGTALKSLEQIDKFYKQYSKSEIA